MHSPLLIAVLVRLCATNTPSPSEDASHFAARARLEQVHEEIVGQRFRPIGQDTKVRLSEVRALPRRPPMRTVISERSASGVAPDRPEAPHPTDGVRRSRCSAETRPPWVREFGEGIEHRSAPATHRYVGRPQWHPHVMAGLLRRLLDRRADRRERSHRRARPSCCRTATRLNSCWIFSSVALRQPVVPVR